MFAVAGVSGHTGAVVAEELIRRGRPVRVIVRSAEKGAAWKARGAEAAVASLDDSQALGSALSGAEGAYLLLPSDLQSTDAIARARQMGGAFADAIRQSGVKHVVFLSSIGAHEESGTGPIAGLHVVETSLRTTGIGVTLLRPAYFLENWGAGLGPAATQGVLPSFLPAELRFPQIATRDIGVAAADALEQPVAGARILELAGPDDYSPNDIAGALGNLLGREVQVAVAPIDAVVPTFTSFGASEHIAGLFRELYEGVISGKVTWDGRGERKRGSTPPAAVFGPMLQG